MTAFYMWRLMFLTFYGEGRMDEKTRQHVHESPRTMTVPLIVLASGSAFAGWLGAPQAVGLPAFFQRIRTLAGPVFEPVNALRAKAQNTPVTPLKCS